MLDRLVYQVNRRYPVLKCSRLWAVRNGTALPPSPRDLVRRTSPACKQYLLASPTLHPSHGGGQQNRRRTYRLRASTPVSWPQTSTEIATAPPRKAARRSTPTATQCSRCVPRRRSSSSRQEAGVANARRGACRRVSARDSAATHAHAHSASVTPAGGGRT